jgi:hypothetical protein
MVDSTGGAPGQGKGRLVHGPGRPWPWPRRPGVRGVRRDRRGRVTRERRKARRRPKDPSPTSGLVAGTQGSHEDVRNSTLPRAFPMPTPRRVRRKVRYAALTANSSSAGARFHAGRSRKSDLRAVPVPDVSRTPRVLGVSSRSQPARAAMRRPGRTSDGRARPSGRPPGPAPIRGINHLDKFGQSGPYPNLWI